MLGSEKPTDIPIRLLYDDQSLNMPTRYACYSGKTLWCSGDGEQAMRLDQSGKQYAPCPCPCPRKEPTYEGNDPCKMNGNLSVMIDGAGGLGGVWNFRTTSYNSIVGILSAMSFLKTITGGLLANIPLRLTVRPKQVTLPKDPTKTSTVYVVGLEFRGDQKMLQAAGQKLALERATHHVRIENIEQEARRLLAAPIDVPLPGDDNEQIVAEFYPEQAEAMEIVRHDGDQAPDRPARPAPPEITRHDEADEPTRQAEAPVTDQEDGPPVEREAKRPKPTKPAPFILRGANGNDQSFEKGADYLKAVEAEAATAPDLAAWWQEELDAPDMPAGKFSNAAHFNEWHIKISQWAQVNNPNPLVKRDAPEWDRIARLINDTLASAAA
jgi:hypothetical protein